MRDGDAQGGRLERGGDDLLPVEANDGDAVTVAGGQDRIGIDIQRLPVEVENGGEAL